MSDQSGAQIAGLNVNWVALGAMIVVGILSLFSLYSGFQSYTEGDLQTAIFYLLMGVGGFAAIGYLLFRSQPTGEEKLQVKEVDVLTTIECTQCNLKRVREFQKGDYLFKNDLPCTRCEGNAIITRIHQKKEEKKRRGAGRMLRPPQRPEPENFKPL
jgi:hypothetical protein